MKETPFVHKFKTPQNHYVYDVNTNSIVRTDETLYRIVDDYGSLPASAIVRKWAEKHEPKSIRDSLDRIHESYESQGLFSFNRPTTMRYPMCPNHFCESLQGKLTDLILNATERCNLRCKYCTYSGSYYYERRHSARDMPWEVAKGAIDYFYCHSQASNKVYVSFFGGEPLLNFDLIKRSIEYTKGFTNWPPMLFHVDTNGTLLTREMMKLMIHNDVILQVSIDGTPKTHNTYRVFESGMGSFYLIARNLQEMREMDRDYYERRVCFAVTLAPPYDLLETYRFFSSDELVAGNALSVNFIHPYDTTFFETFSEQVSRSQLSDHLKALRAKYFHLRVGSSSTNVHHFLKALFEQSLVRIHRRELNPMGANCPANGICVPGVRRLFVDAKGRLYPCERVGQAFCIGHVSVGIEHQKVESLIETYISQSAEDCTSCWALRLCSLCLASARKGSNFDFQRKKENCVQERSILHKSLVLYAEIMEKNPKAFDFVEEMVFE